MCSSGCDFTSIQAAINASSNGDIVQVWDGTYNEHDLDFGGKAITVKSKDGADNCIIDVQGNGRGFHFHNSETSSSVLEGFTIRNGYLESDFGGGIFCDGASPLIRFCVIEDCEAPSGGGIAVDNESSPSIEDTVIQNNRAANKGGGVYIVDSEPALLRLTIDGNGLGTSPTYEGGGVYAIGPHLDPITVLVEGCTVTGNAATSIAGGMGFLGGCVPNIVDCVISGNSSDVEGGGIVLYAVAEGVVVSRCVITQNQAGTKGGGMSISGHDPENELDVSVLDCLISDNQTSTGGQYDGGGGAFLIKTVTEFINCTIANNDAGDGTGGGLFTRYSDVNIKNGIVYGNLADGVSNQLAGSNGATYVVTYSDVEGGYSGTGNINADPLFADDAGGDYRLFRGSPCIDNAKNGDCTDDCNDDGDLLGNTRKSDHLCTTDGGNGTGAIIDMGCYEASKGLIYVDKDATGGNDGSSWANAYTDFKNGLKKGGDEAFADYDPASCEVWVAEGTYKPSVCTSCQTADREATFTLVEGVDVFGGFAGTETARSQRDPGDHETVLSGIIGTTVVSWVHHVVTVPGGITADTELDGFTIKLGKANASGTDQDKGGGLLISGSATLGQLVIQQNLAKDGGGVYIKSGNPSFTDCSLIDNDADNGSGGGKGAGLYVASGGSGSLEFLRCNFNNNTSLDHGAGVYTSSTGAEPHFTNCLFYRNDADKNDSGTRGGAIYTNRKMVLLQCTFAKNWCGEDNKGGGIYNAAGDSILKNCILWKNYTTSSESHNNEGDQIKIASGDVDAFESCIEDIGSLAEDQHFNTGVDPLFQNFNSDNYSLKGDNCSGGVCDSSAVDDGEDDYCANDCDGDGGDDGDLNKQDRKVDLEPNGEQVDMGALETQSG